MISALRENKWRAIGSARMDVESVRRSVESAGWSWENSLHVTASEPMAKALRSESLRALQIVEVDDLIRSAGMPAERRTPVDSYPSFPVRLTGQDAVAESARFRDELTQWRRNIFQRNMRFGIDMDFEIRRHLRQHAPDLEISRLLLGMSRELRQSIVFLINAGFRADDFQETDPALRVALSAWRALEASVPECANSRRDLWERYSDVGSPSDAESVDLRRRVESVLMHLSGSPGLEVEKVQIVYHGFYFYTPPQWALFRLLKQVPNVDQLFVVHDDGKSRAFETWRRYFVERWNMPKVEYSGIALDNPRLVALSNALTGHRIDESALSGSLRIVKCRNSTEFVREWSEEISRATSAGEPTPKLVAAGPSEVKRVLSRMAGDIDEVVDLANLPIGQFLLALHECYDTTAGRVPEQVLDATNLINIVASGFADRDQDPLRPSLAVSAFKRALPFFGDLRLLKDWHERALALERLVKSEVALLGRRMEALSDIDRIETAAGNELRLVPWCDLTDAEATVIRVTITRIGELVEEIVAEGMGRPKNYLEWVRKSLERAMVHLTKEERVELERRLQNAEGVPDYELDFEGVKEVVSMILGRKIDMALDGTLLDDDDGDDSLRVMDIKYADVYGLAPPKGDVHITNLTDSSFPTHNTTYMWPFSAESILEGEGEPVGVELLRTRMETGSLEALYVFWSALGGVPEDRRVTLSWVEESANSIHNPSVLITLLSRMRNSRDGGALEATLGGLETEKATGSNVAIPVHAAVPLAPTSAPQNDVDVAEEKINRIAASSAFMCRRRFAIQWGLGPSASFQSTHTQSMLFGNVQGTLFRRRRFPGQTDRERRNRVYALTRDLWRHLTIGQRKSSYTKARVTIDRATAKSEWTFTLGGKKEGRNWPVDLAYRAAYGGIPIPPGFLAGDDNGVGLPLPDDTVSARECNTCPVAPRCQHRRRE